MTGGGGGGRDGNSPTKGARSPFGGSLCPRYKQYIMFDRKANPETVTLFECMSPMKKVKSVNPAMTKIVCLYM